MKGLIYRNREGELTLLIFHEQPALHVESGPISDSDGLYADLPSTDAEICEVEKNNAIGMVGLKPICGMTLSRGDVNCPAYEAIEACLRDDLPKLYGTVTS